MIAHEETGPCIPPPLRSWILLSTWTSLEEDCKFQMRTAGWLTPWFHSVSPWTEDIVEPCPHSQRMETKDITFGLFEAGNVVNCYTARGDECTWWRPQSWQVAEEIILPGKSDWKASSLFQLNHCLWVSGTSYKQIENCHRPLILWVWPVGGTTTVGEL